ncbi:MAG: response regulator [Armatimonadota bacterium]|jgi:DNA-binding response OmpR family regulator
MGHKILVVDDDADIRELLVTQLTALGYEPVTAQDGVEALDVATSEQPDLMIVDVMMPGLDGFQLVETVSAQRFTKAIPCVFLTARDGVPDRVKGLRLGAWDYITKPFSMSELVARVEGILARSQLGDGFLDEDSAVAGRLEEVSLPGVIQTIADSRLSGVLNVQSDDSSADIWFNTGDIVAVEQAEDSGEDALAQALSWQSGTFKFERQEPPATEPLAASNIELLIKAMKRVDEAART